MRALFRVPISIALVACGFIVSSTCLVLAQNVSSADRAQFQQIISSQIEAFRADDAGRAFSFAAPVIRQKFGSAGTFMQMVQRGYAPVYRPREFSFGDVSERLGKPTQHVTIIGPDGAFWIALYAMEKQPDGTWRIAGVTLLRPRGESA